MRTDTRTRTGRYGPAPQNSDSAVNILLDVVADQSGKTYRMDHYATRYPTNVLDIADFLVRLSGESALSSTLYRTTRHCVLRAFAERACGCTDAL